jgi:hypothetical protein
LLNPDPLAAGRIAVIDGRDGYCFGLAVESALEQMRHNLQDLHRGATGNRLAR